MKLFTEEAVWEMPPFDGWYQGPETIAMLTRMHCPAEGPGDMRFIRTTANGQPAAALYMLNRETRMHEAFQMHVIAVRRMASRMWWRSTCRLSRSSACPASL